MMERKRSANMKDKFEKSGEKWFQEWNEQRWGEVVVSVFRGQEGSRRSMKKKWGDELVYDVSG
jgi:hypothetical protein